jgi:hypothetical protein
MTVAIRHDIVSVSEFDVVCEVREIDSPRMRKHAGKPACFPRGQVPVKVSNALDTFNRRN